MRLTQIKLVGFKSFTDPTTIHVPSQLVGVIGPNGCGKSNVIDAVRWVLGEVSAKQLRGESMQDVIFNGAATRRPAPRASVELVFDNSDHSLQGAWGRFAEVSIKRQLTRQGDSSYFINNQLVRRRDITDLFLGTGVGARGYAVIEQGMISRIIESRPDELRAYIEEAAGVSKYKERRRETESRLNETQEHLQRLSDLQTEITRQTEKLEQQAQTAERYRQLTNELAIQHNLLDFTQWQNALNAADEATIQYETAQNKQVNFDEQNHILNEKIQVLHQQEHTKQETLNQLNAQQVQLRERIARLEEQQRAAVAQQERAERDRITAQNQIAHMQQQHAAILADLALQKEALIIQQSALEETAQTVVDRESVLPDLERQVQVQQHVQQSQQEQLNLLKREWAIKQQQQQHNQNSLSQLNVRYERLQNENVALALPCENEVNQAQQEVQSLQMQWQAAQNVLTEHENHLSSLKNVLQQTAQHWQSVQQQYISTQAQQYALEQMLQTNLPEDFVSLPAFWQNVSAPEKWQHALAVVLGNRYQARLWSGNHSVVPTDNRTWINVSGSLKSKKHLPAQALINQLTIASDFQAAVHVWLDGVLCATDLAYALTHQRELQAHQIWLTPEGDCIDSVSICIYDETSNNQFVQYKNRYNQLTEQLTILQPEYETLQIKYETVSHEYEQAVEQQKNFQNQLYELSQKLQQAQTLANQLLAQTQQGQLRREHLIQELQQIDEEKEILQQQQETLIIDNDTLAQAIAQLESQSQLILTDLNTQQQQLKQAQLALLEANRQHGAAQIAIAKQQQHIEHLQQQAQSLIVQQQEWQQRVQEVAQLALDDVMSQEWSIQLTELHAQSEVLQETINLAQTELTQIQAQSSELYGQMQAASANLPQIQEAIQQALLQQQQALLNAKRHHDNLIERGADLANLTVFSGSLNDLSVKIGKIQEQITSLGAVNLAALAELNETRERGEYYQAQRDDVQAAMDLLQQAILQIDNETKARFKETFDAANAKMQEYFPLLFGGGEASLQLIGDDLLTAGVSIMARPVGKKNATIHLLSGGEKALTAMSLVFALFSLNPAPFCLLDEVDAPLDDANTARFCDLVKQMSSKTQFLYISHNRLTMEMAHQLVGVTMQEKGVSRIVAVDIQEALQLAQS